MGAPVERDEVERTDRLAAPWYATEGFQRSLLALAGALPAVSVAWLFRVSVALFVVEPTFDALKEALQEADLGEVSRDWLMSVVAHLSHVLMLKAAFVGGLALCFPWTAYQAFRYAARRAKPDRAVGVGRFVAASTLLVWGSAWLVPNLLAPPLLTPLLMSPGFDFDMETQLPADFLTLMVFNRVCGAWLVLCVAVLLPVVVAFVICVAGGRWKRLVHLGGLSILLVSAVMAGVSSSTALLDLVILVVAVAISATGNGWERWVRLGGPSITLISGALAAVLSPRGLLPTWLVWMTSLSCVFASAYYAALGVAYLCVRRRRDATARGAGH